VPAAAHVDTIQQHCIDFAENIIGGERVLKNRLYTLPVFFFLLMRPYIALLPHEEYLAFGHRCQTEQHFYERRLSAA
jgi:hypothetical protein